jgi:hypothetical protein
MNAFLRCAALALFGACSAFAGNPANPILFVTQVPMPEEVNSRTITESYQSCVSPFSNHLADTAHAGRGGSLHVRFSNGQVVDLLAVANWSAIPGGQPAAGSVAVRNPSVDWTATKAIFSMVIGKPSGPADTTQFYWQLYEITLPTQAQLNASVKPVLTQVANQPPYNNIFPCYGLGGKIIFSSDRPLNGQMHLTQREEYLGLPTVSGLWSLDPTNAASIKILHHSPSGAFAPMIDSAGRLIFTNWDHLDRDPEAVTDSRDGITTPPYNETFTRTYNGSGNYPDEAVGSSLVPVNSLPVNTWDIFPEPRSFDRKTLIDDFGGIINGNAFNIFMPWMINPDGTGGELLNHVGRHEVAAGATKSYTNDSNVIDLSATVAPTPAYGGLGVHTYFGNLMSTHEDPLHPGEFFGVDAADLGTHGAGQIVVLKKAGANPDGSSMNPDQITVTYITPGAHSAKPGFIPTVKPSINLPATGQTALTAANAENLYRTGTPLADGNIVASHAGAITQTDYNSGTVAQPVSFYAFRLKSLKVSGTTYIPDITLTTGITINTSYYVGSTVVSYNGPAWELDPAEVVARTVPTAATSSVDPIEAAVFVANGVDLPTFKSYLVQHNAALSVSRDVTKRDLHDRQQPFNLKVAWSGHQTLGLGTSGTIYSIAWSQFFQADLRRGYTLGGANPVPGRRVVATSLHDTMSENVATAGAPAGSVRIGDDGSVAAIVPAGRAMTWHLIDNNNANTSQVKERFWVTFQPGEVRTCANCHGINTSDQTGTVASPVGKPTNPPQALSALLQFWKTNHPPGVMQHAQPVVSAPKNAGTATLLVTRTGGSTGPVTVNFTTANGTAVAGVDFDAVNGTLTWVDGDTAAKPITVSLRNNPVIGASKTLSVTLSQPLNGSLGATSTASLTLTEPPFSAWQFARFGANANTPAIAGPAADGDGDGRQNLLEFATNTDPLVRENAPPESSFLEVDPNDGKTYLTFLYKRRIAPSGLTYHVETSTDFTLWKEGAPDVLELSHTPDAGGITETVKARAAAPVSADVQRYIRLRVTQP